MTHPHDPQTNPQALVDHGLGPNAVEIENDGFEPLWVLAGSLFYIKQGDQLVVMDHAAAREALSLARKQIAEKS